MKSTIGTYDEKRLFHTRQIARAPSATNALRFALANPAIQAMHASITPKIGQLFREAAPGENQVQTTRQGGRSHV